MESEFNLTHLNDQQLVSGLHSALAVGHRATAAIVAHLGEVEARKLYLKHACTSMWVYCLERLGLSEPAAFKRLRAARASRQFPIIVERLASGAIHLTAVSMLAPRLTVENHVALLDAAAGRSKAGVERLLAERFPQPDVLAGVRKLPARAVVNVCSAGTETGSEQRSITRDRTVVRSPVPTSHLTPTAPGRYKVQFSAGRELHDKINEARDLMRHRSPDGDFERLFEAAVDLLLVKLRKEKFAETESPREVGRESSADSKRGRHIPSAVKREVARRDEGRCTFVDATGNRCGERAFVEFHHAGRPFGRGGEHSAENLTLFCRPHNMYAGEQDYGASHVRRRISEAKRQRFASKA